MKLKPEKYYRLYLGTLCDQSKALAVYAYIYYEDGTYELVDLPINDNGVAEAILALKSNKVSNIIVHNKNKDYEIFTYDMAAGRLIDPSKPLDGIVNIQDPYIAEVAKKRGWTLEEELDYLIHLVGYKVPMPVYLTQKEMFGGRR